MHLLATDKAALGPVHLLSLIEPKQPVGVLGEVIRTLKREGSPRLRRQRRERPMGCDRLSILRIESGDIGATPGTELCFKSHYRPKSRLVGIQVPVTMAQSLPVSIFSNRLSITPSRRERLMTVLTTLIVSPAFIGRKKRVLNSAVE